MNSELPKEAPLDHVRVNVRVKKSTHHALKVWCAERSMTLQAGVEKILDSAFAKKVAVMAEKETV